MRTLIGIIAAILIFVFLFVIIVPWIAISSFKGRYLHDLQVLAAQTNTKINVIEFRTGPFKSHAKISVEPLNPSVKGAKVLVDQTITSGPIVYDYVNGSYKLGLANVRSIFHLDPMIERLILGFSNAPVGQQGLLEINTIKKFSGPYSSSFKTINVNTQMAGFGKVDWKGIRGTIVASVKDDHLDRIHSSIVLGALNASDMKGTTLNMSDVTLTGRSHYNPIGLFTGWGELFLPTFTFIKPDNNNVKISNLKLTQHFGPEGNFANFDIHLNIESLSLPEIIAISPFTFALNVKNLNAVAIADMVHNPINEEQAKQNPEIVKNKLLQWLTPDTTANGNVLINTSSGRATADYNLGWVKEKYPNPVTQEGLMQAMDFKVTVRAAIPLVNTIIEESNNRRANEENTTTDVDENNVDVDDKQTRINNLTPTVNDYVTQNKISKSTGDKIISLQQAALLPDVYASSINQLVRQKQIPTDVADTLKSNYIKAFAPASPAPTARQAAKPSMQDQINMMIQKGYIVVEGNDYVSVITGREGKIKVNAVDVTNDIMGAQAGTTTAPVTGTPTTAPATGTTTTAPATSTTTAPVTGTPTTAPATGTTTTVPVTGTTTVTTTDTTTTVPTTSTTTTVPATGTTTTGTTTVPATGTTTSPAAGTSTTIAPTTSTSIIPPQTTTVPSIPGNANLLQPGSSGISIPNQANMPSP